jgi:hypothetical protein
LPIDEDNTAERSIILLAITARRFFGGHCWKDRRLVWQEEKLFAWVLI